QPVIAAVGEARNNHEVFRELGVRLGVAEPDDLGEAGALMEVTNKVPAALAPALREGRSAMGPADGHPIQFLDVMPKTADRRVHLFPAALPARVALYHYEADPATAKYPLSLISPASPHTISSTLGESRPGIARVKIHPEDAGPRVIADGDAVRIFNDLGE